MRTVVGILLRALTAINGWPWPVYLWAVAALLIAMGIAAVNTAPKDPANPKETR